MKTLKELQKEADFIHALNFLVNKTISDARIDAFDHGYEDDDCTPTPFDCASIDCHNRMRFTSCHGGDVKSGLEQIRGMVDALIEEV